jgi:hypothetical protein
MVYFANAQERHGGIPLMFNAKQNKLQKLQKAGPSSDTMIVVAKKEFAAIDNEKEREKADSIASIYSYGKGKYYGIGIDVNIDFKKEATVENVGDSGKVYLLKLSSPTAYALQVYFDAFKIPKGSRMFIYDSNMTMFLGSFTHENNFVNNRLGTQFIFGNSLIIEYYEPNNVEFNTQLHIEKLVHVFIDLKHGPFSRYGSGNCNINVNCSLGYGWEREKRSVAIILGYSQTEYKYLGWCSGSLINNTFQDGKPLFLTTNHCISSSYSLGIDMENTADWVFLLQ